MCKLIGRFFICVVVFVRGILCVEYYVVIMVMNTLCGILYGEYSARVKEFL